jgi:hypothetical protein
MGVDHPRADRGERVEGLVLVAILLVVAAFAGAASFTHVKEWTLANSPAGTREWFGWANATISELVPTACALVIRRRRRARLTIAYPLGLLIAAVALSLAAQLAVAKPSPSGWLLSAVPALAFVALTKLVLSTRPPNTDTSEVEYQEAPERPSTVEQEASEPVSMTPVTVLPPAPAARLNGAIPSGVIR